MITEVLFHPQSREMKEGPHSLSPTTPMNAEVLFHHQIREIKQDPIPCHQLPHEHRGACILSLWFSGICFSWERGTFWNTTCIQSSSTVALWRQTSQNTTSEISSQYESLSQRPYDIPRTVTSHPASTSSITKPPVPLQAFNPSTQGVRDRRGRDSRLSLATREVWDRLGCVGLSTRRTKRCTSGGCNHTTFPKLQSAKFKTPWVCPLLEYSVTKC